MKSAHIIYGLASAGGLLVCAMSFAGWGVQKPAITPMSVREESARPGTPGHYNRHRFIGGGLHYGK